MVVDKPKAGRLIFGKLIAEAQQEYTIVKIVALDHYLFKRRQPFTIKVIGLSKRF